MNYERGHLAAMLALLREGWHIAGIDQGDGLPYWVLRRGASTEVRHWTLPRGWARP